MSKIKSFSALPQCITIKPSNLHGLGLFATEDIGRDVKLGLSHIEYEGAKDDLIRTPLGAFINHSFSPNADFVIGGDKWTLVSAKEIKKGEEITADFSPWYEPEVLKTYN